MKEAARSNSLTADFPKRVIDQSAQTRAELLKDWPLGGTAFDNFANKQITEGRWEKVYKRIGNKLVPAYRRPK